MPQQTQINGNRYSFTSIRMAANGRDFPRGVLKSINYNGTQEPGEVQGNQVTLVGLTSGYGKGNGDFEMLVAEFDDFAAALTQNGFLPLMTVDFDIVVSYSVNDVDVRTDVLRGQGTDATAKKCNIVIRRMTLNGIDLFADPAA
jgi:hypothetical protein